MTKNEFKQLAEAQRLLCDIKTIQLKGDNFKKWNEATKIISNLLENKGGLHL